jgi:hypothetical protein
VGVRAVLPRPDIAQAGSPLKLPDRQRPETIKAQATRRLRRPRNWPTGECRQPVDGGCVVSDRLRIGESSGARLAGQLGSNERERLLDEIIGQFSHNAGGLDKVPPCVSRSATRHCSRSAPVAVPIGVAWLRSRTPGRVAAACNAAADRW